MSTLPPFASALTLSTTHHHHRRRLRRRLSPHPYLPLLELCSKTAEFAQVHSALIKLGLIHNTLFSTRLAAFSALSTSSDIDYARRLFDSDPNPNTFAYNVIIRGYSQSSQPNYAIAIFADMLRRGGAAAVPNSMTFPFVLKACSVLAAIEEGRQVHALVFKFGLGADLYIQNSLISMYSKAGWSFDDALKVFDKMTQRDIVSWNAIIGGLASLGFVEYAKGLFDELPERSVATWNCMIDGYVKCGSVDLAKELFDSAPVKDAITWNTMVGGYTGSDRMEEARSLFDRMPAGLKNLTSFNVFIDGYSRNLGYDEVLELFDEMMGLEIQPDKFTLVSVVSACSRLSASERGEWVHSYVDRVGIRLDAVLGTALIDMYAKCGKVERALDVFARVEVKEISIWNAVISNLGLHGYGEEALEFFNQLLRTDVAPDNITFLSVLSACRHSGLVEEGTMWFNLMGEKYGIKPKAEHYGCMVDLLCRAGLLDEAKELVMANAGEEFSVAMWGALLDAASRLGDVEMGVYAAEHLLELDPDDTRCYVALSNLYSRGKEWEESVEVRRRMRSSGMEKVPGRSLIDVDGVVHEFRVGSAFNNLDATE